MSKKSKAPLDNATTSTCEPDTTPRNIESVLDGFDLPIAEVELVRGFRLGGGNVAGPILKDTAWSLKAKPQHLVVCDLKDPAVEHRIPWPHVFRATHKRKEPVSPAPTPTETKGVDKPVSKRPPPARRPRGRR